MYIHIITVKQRQFIHDRWSSMRCSSYSVRVTSLCPLIFRVHQPSIDLSRHLGETLCSITLHVRVPCALYKRTQGDSAPYAYIPHVYNMIETRVYSHAKYHVMCVCVLYSSQAQWVSSITLTWSLSVLADKGPSRPKTFCYNSIATPPCKSPVYMPIYSILYQHTFICNNCAPSDCMHQHIHTRTKEGAINRVSDDGAEIEWLMMVNADICSVIILESVKRTNSKHSQGGGEL